MSGASDPQRRMPALRDVRTRLRDTLIALSPAAALQCWLSGPSQLALLLTAIATALALEATMLRWRSRPWRPALVDLGAVLTAVVFALCLPSAAPWWLPLPGMVVAMMVARHAFGGFGHHLFHPAMAGVAAVWLIHPLEAPAGDTHAEMALAAAYACGGIWLVWRRALRWQTPASVFAAALLVSAALAMPAPVSPPAAGWTMLVLGAFFVAADPTCGGSMRVRVAVGAGIGALLAALGMRHDPARALAGAVLLVNVATPWVEALLDRPTHQAPPA